MSLDLKQQIITSAETIKNKLKQLKDIEGQKNYELTKIFKPITEPLSEMLQSNQNKATQELNINPIRVPVTFEAMSSSTPIIHKRKRKLDETDSEYYNDMEDSKALFSDDKDVDVSITTKYLRGLYDGLNIPFGVRKVDDRLMIGNVVVKFVLGEGDEEPCRIKIDDTEYKITAGLKEMLLRKTPKFELVTEDDKKVYKNILTKTNAHKRDYDDNGQLKGDKGKKYQEIIKPMFTRPVENKQKNGSGYNLNLKRFKKNTDFVYWDDPNELVERLKLLMASQQAGNTSHDNEIISIIEELKEARIIKS